MFKLVGKETFYVGAAKTKATINIDAISGFAYEYTLEINGKSLKKYMEDRSKTTNTWVLHMDGENFRIVLGKLVLFPQNFFFFYNVCLIPVTIQTFYGGLKRRRSVSAGVFHLFRNIKKNFCFPSAWDCLAGVYIVQQVYF